MNKKIFWVFVVLVILVGLSFSVFGDKTLAELEEELAETIRMYEIWGGEKLKNEMEDLQKKIDDLKQQKTPTETEEIIPQEKTTPTTPEDVPSTEDYSNEEVDAMNKIAELDKKGVDNLDSEELDEYLEALDLFKKKGLKEVSIPISDFEYKNINIINEEINIRKERNEYWEVGTKLYKYDDGVFQEIDKSTLKPKGEPFSLDLEKGQPFYGGGISRRQFERIDIIMELGEDIYDPLLLQASIRKDGAELTPDGKHIVYRGDKIPIKDAMLAGYLLDGTTFKSLHDAIKSNPKVKQAVIDVLDFYEKSGGDLNLYRRSFKTKEEGDKAMKDLKDALRGLGKLTIYPKTEDASGKKIRRPRVRTDKLLRDIVTDERDNSWLGLFAALNPGAGAYQFQDWMETWFNEGNDISFFDPSDPKKGFGKFLGYSLAGYETAICDSRRSSYFIQETPGRYSSGTMPHFGSIFYVKGRRTENLAIIWPTSAYPELSEAPKWFPNVTYASDLVTPLGYLYKVEWYFSHPYTKGQVEDMSKSERKKKGIVDKNGTIKYKIVMSGVTYKAKSEIVWDNLRIKPGKPAIVNFPFYEPMYLKEICLIFKNGFELDGKSKWCEKFKAHEIEVSADFAYFPEDEDDPNSTGVGVNTGISFPGSGGTTTTPDGDDCTAPPWLC